MWFHFSGVFCNKNYIHITHWGILTNEWWDLGFMSIHVCTHPSTWAQHLVVKLQVPWSPSAPPDWLKPFWSNQPPPFHPGFLCAVSATPFSQAATAHTETWEIPSVPQGKAALLWGLAIWGTGCSPLISHKTIWGFLQQHLPWEGQDLASLLRGPPAYVPHSFPRAVVLALEEGNSSGIDWYPEYSPLLSWHQLSDTTWESCDSIQFWYLLPSMGTDSIG